jgi:hypothetical protein
MCPFHLKLALVALGSLLGTSIAVAQLPPKESHYKDPVTDLLRSAMQKYLKGDLSGTSTDLEQAKKLVDERRADKAVTLFPTVEGWTSRKVEKQDDGLFGGGAQLQRTYDNNVKKEQRIKAEITMDSPLLKQLEPLLTNPIISKASGYETKKVQGKDALLKKTGEGAELQVWVGSGVLFKLTGSDMPENDLVTFAKNFDFDEIEKLKVAKDPKAGQK